MKVLLSYSGGLDTSLLIPWLIDQGHDVVCFMADLGQKDDLSGLAQKALDAGAEDVVISDLKEEFTNEFVAPAVKFNGLYEEAYPLGTALARYPLARALVKEARNRNIPVIAHGCTGKGNDQVRFEIALACLAPDIEVWAPMRDWGATRLQLMELAEEMGIAVDATVDRPYSVDENLWSRSVEGGALEEPGLAPPEHVFEWTAPPDKAGSLEISIEFQQGLPVALNGEAMALIELIERLNALAGRAGVGRIDHLESRMIGLKSREVYEAPAAITVLRAHKWLEKAVFPPDVLSDKAHVDRRLSEMAFRGLWFTSLTEAHLAFVDVLSKRVSGNVKMRLSHGRVDVMGIESDEMLYSKNVISFDTNEFDGTWSKGFIRISAMAWKTAAEVYGGKDRDSVG